MGPERNTYPRRSNPCYIFPSMKLSPDHASKPSIEHCGVTGQTCEDINPIITSNPSPLMFSVNVALASAGAFYTYFVTPHGYEQVEQLAYEVSRVVHACSIGLISCRAANVNPPFCWSIFSAIRFMPYHVVLCIRIFGTS